MIFSIGTTTTQEAKGMTETPTKRMSDTLNLSISETRVLSETHTKPMNGHPGPNMDAMRNEAMKELLEI